MYAEESVELLRNSGIQFEKHEQVALRISVRIIQPQSYKLFIYPHELLKKVLRASDDFLTKINL